MLVVMIMFSFTTNFDIWYISIPASSNLVADRCKPNENAQTTSSVSLQFEYQLSSCSVLGIGLSLCILNTSFNYTESTA
jgi:hypothetical protein